MELSAHYHAATAELVSRLVELDESRAWDGVGFRTCTHWLAIHTGFDQWTAGTMLRVGHALRELPKLAAGFDEGRLSFDKVRTLIHVATPADEHIWLDIALAASVTQLARICLAVRRAAVIDDTDHVARQQAERTFNAWWQDDGMLRLVATLPPEDGRIVLNAIEDAVTEPTAGAAPAEHPARDTFGSRRADALTRVCEQWLTREDAVSEAGRAPRQLVVHVDVETLVNDDPDGRCHVDGGPAVSAATARRVGCDADVLTMVERGATTLDLHRTRRRVSGRLRRAVQLRDMYCRYPGCTVRAVHTDCHHIEPWLVGGVTTLGNLVSLCAFHHQRLHEGAFHIVVDETRVIEFRASSGTPIGPPVRSANGVEIDGARWLRQVASLAGRRIVPDAAVAGDRGARLDLRHAVDVVTHGVALAAAQAGAPAAPP